MFQHFDGYECSEILKGIGSEDIATTADGLAFITSGLFYPPYSNKEKTGRIYVTDLNQSPVNLLEAKIVRKWSSNSVAHICANFIFFCCHQYFDIFNGGKLPSVMCPNRFSYFLLSEVHCEVNNVLFSRKFLPRTPANNISKYHEFLRLKILNNLKERQKKLLNLFRHIIRHFKNIFKHFCSYEK